MIDMTGKDLLPAISGYVKTLSDTVVAKKAAVAGVTCAYEEDAIAKLSTLTADIYAELGALVEACDKEDFETPLDEAKFAKATILATMEKLRAGVDAAEALTDAASWPLPSYGELLFSVK